ncbi:MAG: hypothetical protein OHK0013_15180 [Sandaracinaceae bacterium]
MPNRTIPALSIISICAVLAAGCDGGGGGPSGGGCTPSADTCTGESICVAGACEAAFGRIYTIMDVSVSVPTTDETGAAWDAFGGAPDPFIVVLVNGSTVATSATRNDTFSGTFSGPYNATLIAGSSLAIQVWDEDVSANDLMFTCQASPIGADLLRQRSLACSSGGFTVSFQIDPR